MLEVHPRSRRDLGFLRVSMEHLQRRPLEESAGWGWGVVAEAVGKQAKHVVQPPWEIRSLANGYLNEGERLEEGRLWGRGS